MTGIGAGPEETGDRVQDVWTDAFADPNADTLNALVAAVEARTREQVAAEAEKSGACDCYPNPFDHEDHCPRRNA